MATPLLCPLDAGSRTTAICVMNHAIEVLMMIGLELEERNRALRIEKGTHDVTWKHEDLGALTAAPRKGAEIEKTDSPTRLGMMQ